MKILFRQWLLSHCHIWELVLSNPPQCAHSEPCHRVKEVCPNRVKWPQAVQRWEFPLPEVCKTRLATKLSEGKNLLIGRMGCRPGKRCDTLHKTQRWLTVEILAAGKIRVPWYASANFIVRKTNGKVRMCIYCLTGSQRFSVLDLEFELSSWNVR